MCVGCVGCGLEMPVNGDRRIRIRDVGAHVHGKVQGLQLHILLKELDWDDDGPWSILHGGFNASGRVGQVVDIHLELHVVHDLFQVLKVVATARGLRRLFPKVNLIPEIGAGEAFARGVLDFGVEALHVIDLQPSCFLRGIVLQLLELLFIDDGGCVVGRSRAAFEEHLMSVLTGIDQVHGPIIPWQAAALLRVKYLWISSRQDLQSDL